MMSIENSEIPSIERDAIVIRFAGDSGDGMQLTGSQFTNTSAMIGNDVFTFPDFPAEIRAPSGTLPGVSGFQLCFSSKEIHTAGDTLHALIAMNPAALKVNLKDLEEGGLIILNENSFTEKEFKKANYQQNPLLSGELEKFRVFAFPITDLTLNAVKSFGMTHSQAMKCKNLFALGIVYWLYSRPLESTLEWLEKKFAQKETIAKSNQAALRAGYNYALTIGLFTERYTVKKAQLPKGKYRQITGNEALALACVAVAHKSERPFLLSGYPITPASAVLSHVAKYQNMGIQVFQAEDEIAAMAATVGSAFGGGMAMTITSGPGFDLKSEALGLAVMTELPCVVVDVQRAGPSTGMPTKTEQADLLMAMYGRHGECPLPILAAQSPSDCFSILIEAFRIAVKYMTPVVVLSDGYLATGAEPWLIPDVDKLPDLKPEFCNEKEENFSPYLRDTQTLARNWAIPGTKNLEHRIGGLEKDFITGNISYDPDNHQKMIEIRANKIQNIVNHIPDIEIQGNPSGKLLVVSWGSTYGSALTAVDSLQQEGYEISAIHLRYLNPFPKNLKNILNSFDKILVPELNRGQLSHLLRAEFLVNAISYSKVTGKPFLVSELQEKILSLC
jgi:2-oxoglutarate ferredoxin oxidoreductase subunit alpha